MIKHYCDICGKEMKDTVFYDSDPFECCYGECKITFHIGLQGIYDVGFDEICHECKKRIEVIDIDDFHKALKKLMKFPRSTEKGGVDNA